MPPSALLGAAGPFARHVPGFGARPQQQEMADLVGAVLAAGDTLICEAGTGTGKTFAYLVPALTSGLKTIVSTATKTLQDQLFRADIPTVLSALDVEVSVALLKGRANYLCLQRLEQAAGDPLLDADSQAHRETLSAWAIRTVSGDIAEAAVVPEDAPIWPLVTSTVDNCLGQACPFIDRCFVVRARREAASAEVVVVNHHLLFADMALREEGFAEILPTAQAVVLDEAHQLPETAALFFGAALSSRQLRELCRDTAATLEEEAPDMPSLREAVAGLEYGIRTGMLHLGGLNGRLEWANANQDPRISEAIAALRLALANLAVNLEAASVRGPGLAHCHKRAEQLHARLAVFTEGESADWVRWCETSPRGFVLHSTPLSVAELFQNRIKTYAAAWIYTSATLAVEQDFTHFRRQMGLEDAREALWKSPFDYAQQALMYLPSIPVEPSDRRYLDEIAKVAAEVIVASRGRTFLLFTSYRALEGCAERLRSRCDYPLLVQGSVPRGTLLDRFRTLGNAVLLGTATFWEGVDVRGEALSCVLIDKLPFAPPDDPVTSARVRAMKREGINAFYQYQIPQAAIALKQGAGRLIRDSSDRGVLVLCDPRLQTRAYGRVFLQSLPEMTRTQDLDAVRRFFAHADAIA